jgi:peroxiredoxin
VTVAERKNSRATPLFGLKTRNGISSAADLLTFMTLISRRLTYHALALGLLALVLQTPLFAQAAAPWELKDVNGNTVKSSDFKGKVVVLNFWATWCPPCLAEIPDFMKLQDAYSKQGVTFVGISVDQGGPKVVADFVTRKKLNYPIVLGNLDVAEKYNATDGIPDTFVIDRKGNITATFQGKADATELEKDIKKNL